MMTTLRRLAPLAVLLSALAAARAAPAQEVVEFKSEDGTPLTGFVFRPARDGPFPGVVMLHGCSGMLTKSGRLKKREMAWAAILTAEGYAVMLPDSFTPRGYRTICRVKDRPVRPDGERPFDAYGALRWFQGQPFVRAERIVLAGWSNGAMTMLWTMRDKQDARPAGLAHDFVAAVGFYPGCVELRKKVPYYRPIAPVLIQMGADDNWTLPKPCASLVEETNDRAGKPVMEIDLYDGAYHNFDHPSSKVKEIVTRNSALTGGEKRVMTGSNPVAREEAIRRVLDWLGPRLKDRP